MSDQAIKSMRFPSLSYDASRTRTSLRNRFARFLSVAHALIGRTPSEVTLTDETLLRLLARVHIEHAGNVENARSQYQAKSDPANPAATFDELIGARWIRIVRNRIVISVELLRSSKSALPEKAAAAYEWLQQHQYDQMYAVDSSDDSDLAATIQRLEAGELDLSHVGSQRPEWVAARLWEVLRSDLPDAQTALVQWLDRWGPIGRPRIVPIAAWDKANAEAFHAAAIQLLATEPMVSWDGAVEQFGQQIANVEGVEIDVASEHFVPVPKTLVERYLWLTSRLTERLLHWAAWPLQDFAGLIAIPLADIEQTDLSSAPHPLFEQIMAIIEERPEFLFLFCLHIRNHPVLLADLVLRPSTSAWACLLVWRWQLRRDAFENNALRSDDDRNREISFADAIAVTRILLDQKKTPAAEVAALLTSVYRDDKATFDLSRETIDAMRKALLDELIQARAEKIHEVLQALFASMSSEGPGTGTFDAALALIDASHLVGVVDPAPLVIAYAEALTRGNYSLSAHQISISQAHALYKLAMRTETALQRRFLEPLHASVRPATKSADGVSQVAIADSIARSARVHIRVLCRAIVAQAEQVPALLLDALLTVVRAGALSRVERDQVDAFSAHYEADFPKKEVDRSISADMGDALRKLQGVHREKLLEAVLEIEEPLVVAQLLFFTPAEIHSRIQARVAHLTPEKASDLYMLSAVQKRIDELLDAGFADAAASFLDAEGKATTLGAVPGRSVNRLRQNLRLHLLRQQWKQIEQFSIPNDVPEHERESAKETIEFYQALASLRSQDTDHAAAEQSFAALLQKHPHVPAYAINLHATRVGGLLGNDIFGYINEDQFNDALTVIAQGEQALMDFRGLSSDDAATIHLNNALLFLAMKQPARALDALQDTESDRPRETFFAYRALALERSGRSAEALAALQSAEKQFGKTQLLEAVSKQIEKSAPFAGQVNTIPDEDSVSWIRRAFGELTRLDAAEQARALSSEKDSIGDFLLRHVREAAAGVVNLVPMMRGLNLISKEDDITAVLQEILAARLRQVNWSVHDQSKGGFTHTGKPGERDLLVKKDTGNLTIIEAILTRSPSTQQFTLGDLTSHFQKLFAYAECPVYFHITYEMSGDRTGVLEHLKKASKENTPPGVSFVEYQDLPFNDSSPTGFSAAYDTEAGLRKIHFLVLDLHQGLQKSAAIIADKSNPRKMTKSAEKRPKTQTGAPEPNKSH